MAALTEEKKDNFVINCDTWTIFRWEDIFIRRITNEKNHLKLVASSLLTLTSIERVQDKFCPQKINIVHQHVSAKANQQQKNHPWNVLPVQLVGFLNFQPLKYWNICSSSHVIILNTSIYFSVSKFLRWGKKMLERGVDMKLIPVEKFSAEASVSSCAVTNQKSPQMSWSEDTHRFLSAVTHFLC